MLFFLHLMVLDLYVEIVTKSIFPPPEKFLSFLFTKFKNCIWNVSQSPCGKGDNIIAIIRNHLPRNPRNSKIKAVNITQT